jgi:hypothetical protein
MKKILLGTITTIVILVIAFFALNSYIYQEKQADPSMAFEENQQELPVADAPLAQGELGQDEPVPTDQITVSAINGSVVTFLVTANTSEDCKAREYKIDYGDGENDWLQIEEGVCAVERSTHTHTYSFDGEQGLFIARLHDLTNVTYHEPAFDEVQNPISSTEVRISR